MKNLQLTKPHLITVVGIPGSGKTFFAEKFAETFSAPFLNHATIREYTDSSEAAETLSEHILDQFLRTKQTVIVEGRGNARIERQQISARARANGYEPLFIWVQTEPLTAEVRATKGIRGQKNDTLISREEFDAGVKRFTPLNATEKYMVISGKHTYASQAKIVLKKLVEPRAAATHPQAPERPVKRPTGGRITIN